MVRSTRTFVNPPSCNSILQYRIGDFQFDNFRYTRTLYLFDYPHIEVAKINKKNETESIYWYHIKNEKGKGKVNNSEVRKGKEKRF